MTLNYCCIMENKKLILKTHGLRNSREVGIVVLPDSFYVKVEISENGEYSVEFFNSMEEQLFSVCHKISVDINRIPTEEEIKKTEKIVADFIVDTLARHLLDDSSAAYDTESYLPKWSAQMLSIFHQFPSETTNQSKGGLVQAVENGEISQ